MSKTVTVTTSVVGDEGSELEGLHVSVTMGGVLIEEVGNVGARLATAALVALGKVRAVRMVDEPWVRNLVFSPGPPPRSAFDPSSFVNKSDHTGESGH